MPKSLHVESIAAARDAVAAAERALFVAVCQARQDVVEGWRTYGQADPGITWDDVAELLGVSKQAAAKRFGGWRYDEPTDQLIRERPML